MDREKLLELKKAVDKHISTSVPKGHKLVHGHFTVDANALPEIIDLALKGLDEWEPTHRHKDIESFEYKKLGEERVRVFSCFGVDFKKTFVIFDTKYGGPTMVEKKAFEANALPTPPKDMEGVK